MKEIQHLGYIVVGVTKADKVVGFASGQIKNFRQAHAERRKLNLGPKFWRVAIVSGFVR